MAQTTASTTAEDLAAMMARLSALESHVQAREAHFQAREAELLGQLSALGSPPAPANAEGWIGEHSSITEYVWFTGLVHWAVSARRVIPPVNDHFSNGECAL